MKPLALTLCTLFAAVGALAQNTPCSVDADCADGEACVDGACSAAAPPVEQPCSVDEDCGPDQLCAIVDCARPCDAADPDCEPTDCAGGGFCIDRAPPPPPPCASDDDCDGDDVCITGTVESCAGSGCACPDDGDGDASNDPPCDCGSPTPPECTTETFAFCGPRYLDDCAVDADCGPGFTCEIHDACDCSTDPCDCPTEPGVAPPGTCALVRVECVEDADCTDGFVCVAEATTEPCFVDDAGNTSCDAPAATKVCQPPGYFEGAPAPGVEGATRDGDADNDADDADDAGDDDDQPGLGNDVVIFACAQGNAAGALPLAALALLLRRRRR
jgi:hypothetical protein